MKDFENVLLSHWEDTSNGAINTLLSDYKLYHGVIFALFLILAIGSIFLAVRLFKKYRQAEKKTFESKSLLAGFIGTVVVVALSSLLAFANAGNTFIQPKVGFQTMTETLKNSTNEAVPQVEKDNFANWVESKDGIVPTDVKQQVTNWRVFHVRKAVVSAIILIALMGAMLYLWRRLVRKDRLDHKLSFLNYAGFFALTLPTGLFLLMVMANIQGAISPLFSYLVKLT